MAQLVRDAAHRATAAVDESGRATAALTTAADALRPPPGPRPPVLPLEVFDAATQRLYASSLFGVLQAYKAYHILENAFSNHLPWIASQTAEAATGSRYLLLFYSLLDVALILAIQRLRIPRLDWPLRTAMGLCALMLALNWVLLGDWRVMGAMRALLPTTLSGLFDTRLAITEASVRLANLFKPTEHILGTQTIHILPFATAALNPAKLTFCLAPGAGTAIASLPLVFNNTRHPHSVRYSIADFATGQRANFTLSERDLASSHVRSTTEGEDDDDELERDWAEWMGRGQLNRRLEKSQKLFNLQIRTPGVVRLEGAVDKDRNAISVGRSQPVVVTQCPHVAFTSPPPTRSPSDPAHLPPRLHRCIGTTERIELTVQGVPPLSLHYTRQPGPKDHKPEQLSLTGLGSGRPPSSAATELHVDAGTGALVHRDDYTWAASQRIVIPLDVSFAKPGLHEYRLDLVRDSLGHTFHAATPDTAARSFVAHEAARAKLTGCGAGEPIGLAQNRTTAIGITLSEGKDQQWTARVRFAPDNVVSPRAQAWERDVAVNGGRGDVSVDQPGRYELVSLNSAYCEGSVLLPSSCQVVWLPTPTLGASFETIKDQCAGEIGVRAFLELSGAPPFTVTYVVTPQGGRAERKTKQISGTRDELSIRPERSGRFSLELLAVDDANYRQIPITGPRTVSADVRPLASARFLQHEQAVYSCQGSSVEVKVAIDGEPPYVLEYETLSGSSRKRSTFRSTSSTPSLTIKIPSNVERVGGAFEVSLLTIEDGRKCKRSLSERSLRIEVHRTPPLARFGGSQRERHLTIKDGDGASLPLGLTGNGPWTVKYRITSRDGKTHDDEKRFKDANSVLAVTDAGTYEILEVRDAHCPGAVDGTNAKFVVDILERPVLRVQSDAAKTSSDGTTVRSPVCQGVPDSIDLQLTGSPPLEVLYELAYGSHKSQERVLAVSDHANIALSTSEAGMHTYRILGVTDAIYGSPDQGILALSNGKPGQLTIKQDVHARPTARFETATQRTTFCVRDELRPSRGAPTAELQLTGKAPYEVLLELGEPSRHQPIPHRIRDIATKAWALQLDHVFEHAGPHEVVVRSIVDANGCERAYEAAAAPRMTIDVAEIATIAAVAPQNDYCVGQSLDFTLQGTQPWSVTYSWTTRTDKGRSHDVEKTVTTRDPLFSRLARAPGVFRVLSVAHERDQCRSTVDDIVKTVHALPTARVGKGRRSVESIHEGEQAEIVFEFEGTPPFSFTWQRSAPQDRARRPVVLEEQTVNDIRSHSYSLLTSVEGTWSVVFVQDAYCAFPPVQQLGDPQKRITQ